MTYLELVNKVLVRMREDPVATTAENSYSTLVREFVLQAVSEVEDSRDWNALRTTIQVDTAADNFQYVLTDAGTSYNILCVFVDSDDYEMDKAPSYAWMNQKLLSNNVQSAQPQYYDINGVDSNGDPVVNFYPVPDGVYNVNFNMKIKTDFTTDTVSTPVPWLPVVLRATMFALDERGDDAGASLEILQAQYDRALSDANSYDAILNEDETIWEVE